MKAYVAALAVLTAFSTASAGTFTCTANQAAWEAAAFLKFRHAKDQVIRQVPHGTGPWLAGQVASEYTIQYVAIPKDAQRSDCCSSMGRITIKVLKDQTCDFPHPYEETSFVLPTDENYDFAQFMADLEKQAP